MLTKEHAIARYDFTRQLILPDRLTTREHAHYLEYSERMLEIYRAGAGCRRRELHRRVHAVFGDEPDCPQRRVAAFCFLMITVSPDDEPHVHTTPYTTHRL